MGPFISEEGKSLFDLLPPIHQRMLTWFLNHADSVEPWPSPIGEGIYFAGKAKGIY